MKSFKKFLDEALEFAPEATSEVEIMPEIDSDSSDPKELKIKKKKTRKEEFAIGESIEVEVDGEMMIIEKKKGLDGKACWKGYKLAGTKKKGGKTVDNCVKAGFEPEGEEIAEKKLDPVGKEDGDVDNDGDKDKSDKYLMNRRRAIAKAIGKKKK
tara:strand:- start:4664 stop:5128 length:465 start_codon:yes stop_codon:yes gene_type:complete